MQAAQQRMAARPSTSARVPTAMLRVATQRLVARPSLRVRSSSDEEAPAAPTGSLFELTKDNYWEYLKAEENKGVVVVVDCYTDWCGPCKMIYPELVKMSAELEPRARIVKFNCNKYNKELGVQLKIKVAPTFLVYRDGEKVGEMTGAKVEKLRKLISDKMEGGGEPVATATSSVEAVAMSSYSQQPE